MSGQLACKHVVAGIRGRLCDLNPKNRLEARVHAAKTVLSFFPLKYLADRIEIAHSVEGRVRRSWTTVAEVAARAPVIGFRNLTRTTSSHLHTSGSS